MACPHCGTNNPPTVDEHWLFRCPKCSRGKVRPLPVEKPVPPPDPQKVLTPRRKEQPHASICPKCGVEFMTKAHHPSPKCPECRLEYDRFKSRRWAQRKKEERENRREVQNGI